MFNSDPTTMELECTGCGVQLKLVAFGSVEMNAAISKMGSFHDEHIAHEEQLAQS